MRGTYIDHCLQGLKRLKKLQPMGRCGQLRLSQCSTTSEFNCNHSSNGIHSKEIPDNVLRARSGVVTTSVPISIKYKKLVSEDAMSKETEHRKNRFQHAMVRHTREPPPLEIGPKRLKVRGPVFLGSESRMD